MFRNFKMVSKVVFGRGCFDQLDEILSTQRADDDSIMIFLVDDVFDGKALIEKIPARGKDLIIPTNVDLEPKTGYIDELSDKIKDYMASFSGSLPPDSMPPDSMPPDFMPSGVIGIGGGSVMDIAKAVSLMLSNKGKAHEYQGWDLINNPAVWHMGVPTLSGTGSEVSRTTVLTGPEKKLGINSDYTVFDQILLDPELIADVPADQHFYTGMDCYIHCVESLTGSYLNAFSQSYGEKSLELCRDVFLKKPQDSDDKLMMASYFGGMSIAYSQVGICHALSYGLSFARGIHHGVGNCLAFDSLDEYYTEGVIEFREMMKKNKIQLPKDQVENFSDEEMETMTNVALVLEPLWENALGKDWKEIMTREKIKQLYSRMSE
ncbi:iron-containing alcohol dehydrogenase family protein [Desulfobacterales bacterium HSG16]|nr:iron-containing alcohol dehydrogenase family protein [Desulfobacterales bacterium HSG16]